VERLRLATTFAAEPAELYQAWITGTLHAEMTGAPATSEPAKGGAFTAWGGYITGKHLVLEPSRRVVQTWRTTEFPANAPDSTLEIRISKAGKGSRFAVLQSDIPDGQSDQYAEGWVSHYFDPMTAYFAKTRHSRAKKKKAAKSGAKRAAAIRRKPAKKTAERPTKKRTKKAQKAAPRPVKKTAKRAKKKLAPRPKRTKKKGR
jgi:uncharacterized protein YndB with AHSA1/START domain